MMEHSSDLVLRTKGKNRDAFLFRVQGLKSKGEKKLEEKSKPDDTKTASRKVSCCFWILYLLIEKNINNENCSVFLGGGWA